ncbi:MAG: hypothetical protein H7833_11595 [Magnetococcus sp. DMHC-1]|nr:hypothetical protein [Magnetococcales bacterium]
MFALIVLTIIASFALAWLALQIGIGGIPFEWEDGIRMFFGLGVALIGSHWVLLQKIDKLMDEKILKFKEIEKIQPLQHYIKRGSWSFTAINLALSVGCIVQSFIHIPLLSLFMAILTILMALITFLWVWKWYTQADQYYNIKVRDNSKHIARLTALKELQSHPPITDEVKKKLDGYYKLIP